jgi:hypothetical protein
MSGFASSYLSPINFAKSYMGVQPVKQAQAVLNPVNFAKDYMNTKPTGPTYQTSAPVAPVAAWAGVGNPLANLQIQQTPFTVPAPKLANPATALPNQKFDWNALPAPKLAPIAPINLFSPGLVKR